MWLLYSGGRRVAIRCYLLLLIVAFYHGTTDYSCSFVSKHTTQSSSLVIVTPIELVQKQQNCNIHYTFCKSPAAQAQHVYNFCETNNLKSYLFSHKITAVCHSACIYLFIL